MKPKKTNSEVDMKSKLSALWLFAMLTYTYGDVVTLMDPIKHHDIELTEAFLLGGSIYMMIPLSMVLLSRLLDHKANRLACIIAGSIMTITLIMTLLVGAPTVYYVFFATVEIACTTTIVIFAWNWRIPISTQLDKPNENSIPVSSKLDDCSNSKEVKLLTSQ